MTIIKLVSSDGKCFKVDLQIAQSSILITDMLDLLGAEQENMVPVSNVKSEILIKVIEWAIHHHKDDPSSVENDGISNWDAEFIKMDQDTLFELIKAANYLNIQGLLELGYKTVAKMMRGKSADELRNMFNILNNFTPDKLEEVRKENKWLLDN